MEKADDVTKSRYAQMQSSIMNKWGGGGTKVTLVGKLGAMEEELRIVDEELRTLLSSTEESTRHIGSLKKSLGEKQLEEWRGRCGEQTKSFERNFQYFRSAMEQRTNELWTRCTHMQTQTNSLKDLVSGIGIKLMQLENVVGYYNGSDIVSQF